MGENLSTREVIEELSRQENKAKRNSSEAVEERKEKRAPRQKRRVCAFCMAKSSHVVKQVYVQLINVN